MRTKRQRDTVPPSKDRVRAAQKTFHQLEAGEDYRVAIDVAAAKDIRQQSKKRNKEDMEKVNADINDLRIRKKWRKSKMVGRIKEPNGNETNLYQTYSRRIGSQGRFWFVLKDEAPPKSGTPTVLLLGCELWKYNNSTNRRRRKQLLRLPGEMKLPDKEDVPEVPVPSAGRAVEFPYSHGIRVWINGTYDEAMLFLKHEMNIIPKEIQLEAILQDELPIFINGQAGTGKTVMLCLRVGWEMGVRADYYSSEKYRTLVTSMSDSIVDKLEENVGTTVSVFVKKTLHFSPKTFESVDNDFRRSIKLENKEKWKRHQDINRFVCFRSFKQIQLDLLLTEEKQKFELESTGLDKKLIAFSRFSSDFFSKRDFSKRGLGVELAWFGIRSIVRGMCGSYDGKYLNLSQISDHCKIHHFTNNQVELLAECHDSYTKWLFENGYFDDMDLARQAWINIKKGAEFVPFDDIYLDEAQDLTELELKILYSLLKPDRMNHLILAGDPLQTINPTGFSWDAVSSMIWGVLKEATGHEQKVSPAMLLNQNHRTPEDVVSLGNEILKRRAYYQKETYTAQISNLPAGSVSLLPIGDDNKEAITALMYQDADRFIIASQADEDGLVELLADDNFVESREDKASSLESITGVKGHEKNTVILYRMAEDLIGNKDTSRILNEELDRSAIDGQQMVRLCYELNKLYIGITRSKGKLVIIEKDRTAELFWESGIFSNLRNTNLLTRYSPSDVKDELQNLYDQAADPSKLGPIALDHYKRFKEDDPTHRRIRRAKEAADAADPPLEYREHEMILGHFELSMARERPHNARKHFTEAAEHFVNAGSTQSAVDIRLDHLKNPDSAWRIMRDSHPTTFRTEDEWYIIAAMYSNDVSWANPDSGHFTKLCNIIETLSSPKWWEPKHSIVLSRQFLKICNDCLNPDDLISKYEETASSKFFTQSESEAWYKNWREQMESQYQNSRRLWDEVEERFNESKLSPSTSNPLHESHTVKELLNSTGSVLLEESKTVTSRINIMMKWYDSTGKSEETKHFPRKVIEEMIEEEFENLTSPQLSGGSPWIPKLSGHINNINWANQNGYSARGKAITLLGALTSGVKAADHYDLNSSTMSVLWECVNTKQSELDRLTENLSDFTDEEHLNKHIRIIVDNWLISKSETRGETNKFYGLRKTTCWKDCCEHRGKMSALLGFFSNQTPEQQIIRLLRCFEEELQKGDGRTDFDTEFQDIAANVLSKDPRTQTQRNLRKALCEKGKWAFFERRKIHQSHKTFAEAYRVYKKETVQVSNEKLEETANSFESIGEDTLARETRNRIVKPPSEVISDTIANSDLGDQQKVATILQALIGQGTSRERGGTLSATNRKKLFVEYILDDFDLRLILLQNFENFREELTTIAKGIKSNPADDPIILHLRSHPNNFFQFLWDIDNGNVELLDPIQQHKEAIWSDVGETCSQLTNTEFGHQYTEATENCKRSFFRAETNELAFRAASLIALYAQLENNPTISVLSSWREYFGQSPKAKDRRADHLRELLSEFEGNLLYDEVGLLEAYARILDK